MELGVFALDSFEREGDRWSPESPNSKGIGGFMWAKNWLFGRGGPNQPRKNPEKRGPGKNRVAMGEKW